MTKSRCERDGRPQEPSIEVPAPISRANPINSQRWMMLSIEPAEVPRETPSHAGMPKLMMEPAELSLHATYFPFGFPAEVRTNSGTVLELFAGLWGKFSKQRDTEPIRCEVQLVEGHGTACPLAPVYRLMLPLMISIADADNHCIVDLERAEAKIAISRAALRHPGYVPYFFLGVPVCCIATRYATPVHAACVALNGQGVLLCGDSGAGKSTLAYACARSGWTYVSDDGAYILDGGVDRQVTGNCHQVRFRPSATKIFPEFAGYVTTPRAAGKPSIELPTAPMAHVKCVQSTRANYICFLKRSADDSPQIVPFGKDLARRSMRQVLYGSKESLKNQYEAIEQLLTAEVFELRYSNLDRAVDRLQSLVAMGR